MHPQKKQAIAKQITNIAKKSIIVGRHQQYRSRTIGVEGRDAHLIDDVADAYDSLLKELAQHDDWTSKFSEPYIGKAINQLIIRAIDQDIEADFDRLVQDLDNYSQEQVVHVPIVGLQMPRDGEMPFGRVNLKNMTRAVIDTMYGSLERKIRLNINNPKNQNELMTSVMREQFAQLENLVCAEFRVLAEPTRAKERAEEEARRVIDLLYYAMPFVYPTANPLEMVIALQGEAYGGRRVTPIFPVPDTGFSLVDEVVGPRWAFELLPQYVGTMRASGVFEMSEVLRKEKPTSFEELILRGIHWFANSQTQIEKANRLLGLMTCLEAFLSRGGTYITGTVSEGSAILLAQGFDNRKAIMKRVSDIYGMRSAISHSGKIDILEADIAYLKDITLRLLREMILRKSEFNSKKDLDDWIDRQKLG